MSPWLLAHVCLALVLGLTAVSVWAMLRDETPVARTVVLALVVATVVLRVFPYRQYPALYSEDEPASLSLAVDVLQHGESLGAVLWGAHYVPYFSAVVLHAPLYAWVGGHWAYRGYALLAAACLTVGVYALARRLTGEVIAALAAAGLVMVLPWSLLYGRTDMGASVVWAQVLALWGAAAWLDGHRPRLALVAMMLGLWLAVTDYWAGRAVPWMLAVLAVRERRRAAGLWLALGIVALAYLPAFWYDPHVDWPWRGWHLGRLMSPDWTSGVYGLPAADLGGALWRRAGRVMTAFAQAGGAPLYMSVPGAAWQPWWLLALAAIAWRVATARQCWWLVTIGVGGAMPALLAQENISTHRLLTAYVAFPLAAAVALAALRWTTVQAVLAAVLVAVTAHWSLAWYFSDAFWSQGRAYTHVGAYVGRGGVDVYP